MNNVLRLKIINELNELSFFVPSYQRGYRWTEKEVIDLLDDINEFTPRQIENDSDSSDMTWYCLQPIVVKARPNEEYEVIDGQQRLTTIFLILHYLNQDLVENRRITLFTLHYETRSQTEEFLKSIAEDTPPENHENIDFYYIQNTYKTISRWFEKKEQEKTFDKNNFSSKFKFHTKVIWYESFEEDSISIFTRINIGKIPLTNAELIKALFLNNANFQKSTESKRKSQQLEISTKWDEIERKLQNDRFWFFLADNQIETNRIEFIFNLMNDSDEKDSYSTFRYFTKKLKKGSIESVDENWSGIEKYFQIFSEWFEERDLYHKIGYLLTSKFLTIKTLYNNSLLRKKTEFNSYLDTQIKESIRSIVLDEIQYGSKHVQKILLLYNILTMLRNSNDNSSFPFDIYKKDKWDIEHITSVKDSVPEGKNRGLWLSDAEGYIDATMPSANGLRERIDACNCEDDLVFESLFNDIISHFNADVNDDDINGLSNLALLNSETNRGYKNAVFPFKRNSIIDRDKRGVFIPICTKNVFLKYFSSYPPKISFWTSDDRAKYEEDLHNVLDTFLERGIISNDTE